MNHTIKNIATNPRAAALIGFLLALPIPLIFSIAVLEVEPIHGFLKPLFTEADGPRNSTAGLIFFLGAMLLLPVALVINLQPALGAASSGGPRGVAQEGKF